jgi:hypothetical protein
MKGIRKQDFFILICIPVCLHSLNIINITYKVDTVKPTHIVTSIKSNLPMCSPLLSQTCPCVHLY